MKLKKLLTTILGMIFMFSIVSAMAAAVDISPVVSLTANFDRTTTTVSLTAIASDVLDNAGLAWINITENGNTIASKNCGMQKVCVLNKVVVKTLLGGTFDYQAHAFDRGGHLVDSDVQTITFAGVDEEPPEYSDVFASPASPAGYGHHQFNVTWVDNGRIGKVWIEHNFFGPYITLEVPTHNGDEYYYNADFLELGNYRWRMFAEDVAEQGPNEATTIWQDYTVVRAGVGINWTVTPGWTAYYGNTTAVMCSVLGTENGETVLNLYRDGALATNPEVAILPVGTYEYICNGSETEHYASVSENRTLVVEPGPSQVVLAFNGTSGNMTNVERFSETVNVTGTTIMGNPDLELYINGTNIINGTSPLQYLANFTEIGTYNITVVSPGTVNYQEASETYFVTVVDTTAPGEVSSLQGINATAGSITVNWTNPLDDDLDSFVVNATSLVDVNDTQEYNITGVVNEHEIVGLSPSTQYNITVWTQDRYGQVSAAGASIVASTAPDLVPPKYSAEQGPTGVLVYDPNATYFFRINWTDDGTVDDNNVSVELDGMNYSASRVSGDLFELNMTGISGGTHAYTWHAYDLAGNSNSTQQYSFTISNATASCSLDFDPSVVYGTSVLINGTCVSDGAVTLSRDGVDVTATELNQGVLLPVGSYYYELNATATQNYTEASAAGTLVVDSPVSLNVQYGRNNPVNITMDYTVIVKNMGGVQDSYTVDITAVSDPANVNLNWTTYSLPNMASGEERSIPLAANYTASGNYNFTVYVDSNTDTSLNNSVLVDVVAAEYSHIVNSTVFGVPYVDNDTVLLSEVFASYIEDSTVTNTNSSIELSSLYSSAVDDSRVLDNANVSGSTVRNSTVQHNAVVKLASLVEDSFVDNSELNNSDVLNNANVNTNSVLENTLVDNSYVENAVLKDTGSSCVWDMEVLADSRVINSTILDSHISNSNVYNSAFACAYIVNSKNTIINSDVSGSVMDNVTIIDSNATYSKLINVDISDSNINDSTVEDVVATNTTIQNSDVQNTVVADAVIVDGVISSGSIQLANGTVVDITTPTNLTELINYAPVAGISPASATITEGGSVSFTSTSTDANVAAGTLNDSLNYSWSFGDGGTSTAQNPSKTYSNKGTYTVTLTVTDSFGETDNASMAVVVNEKSSSHSSGGSSGGSSHSSSPTIFDLTAELVPGAQVRLVLGEDDIVKFMFEGAEYAATVKDISYGNASFHIEPADIDVALARSQLDHINLDGDMLNDLELGYAQFLGSRTAEFVIGIKEKPVYDPIYIPEAPEPEDHPEQGTEQEEGQEEDAGQDDEADEFDEDTEPVELNLWQKLVEGVKNLFSRDSEDGEEPELTPAAVVDTEGGEEGGSGAPKALLGYVLVLLIIALGVGGYFIAKKKTEHKLIEQYLE